MYCENSHEKMTKLIKKSNVLQQDKSPGYFRGSESESKTHSFLSQWPNLLPDFSEINKQHFDRLLTNKQGLLKTAAPQLKQMET